MVSVNKFSNVYIGCGQFQQVQWYVYVGGGQCQQVQ